MYAWCSNIIVIEADNSEIERLVNSGLERNVLEKFYPMPEHVFRGKPGEIDNTHGIEEAELAQYPGELHWYNWRLYNWGPIWDTNPYDVQVLDGKLIINCKTALASPSKAFLNYTRDHSKTKVTVEYVNLRVWLKGTNIISCGQYLETHQMEPEAGIDYDPADYLEDEEDE